MKLIEKIWQHRYDFSGIYECEHCKSKREIKYGYDDRNYHMNVIPEFICESCGKNRAGLKPTELKEVIE